MPATARKPREPAAHVNFKAPQSLVRKVDKLADDEMADRSTMLRILLRRGLATTPKRYFIGG